MSFEDHWPNNRQHQLKTEDGKEFCTVCGAIPSWATAKYPCGSHSWDLIAAEHQITIGLTENGGFWPLAWPDNLGEDRAAEVMHAFFREHGDSIKEAFDRKFTGT